MLKYFPFVFLLIQSIEAWSQEQDSTISQPHIVVGELDSAAEYFEERGLFIDVGIQQGPVFDQYDLSSQFSVGLAYKKWSIAFQVHDFVGVEGRRIIFPNLFFPSYRYGSLLLSYQVANWQFVRAKPYIKTGIGDAIWENSAGENRFRDRFTILEPGVELEVRAWSFLRLFGQVGYRQMIGLSTTELESNDLSGIAGSLGLRIGLFQQIKNKTGIDNEQN